MEKGNGIVDYDSIFNMGGEAEQYSREDDILPVGGKGADKPVEGLDIQEEPVDKPKPKPDPKQKTNPEPEPKPDPKQKTKPELDNRPVVDYKGIINKLAKRGSIPDMKGVSFEDEAGSEVPYEGMEIQDEDSFLDVMETILANQKETLTAGKIDAASVSDFTKKLIEADKSGADIVGLLKEYDRAHAPLDKLNMDNKGDQLKVIAHYVGLMGLPKDEAEDYYNSIVSKGDDYIESKALKYKAELDKRMEKLIEEETARAAKQKAEDAENLKRFKKSVKAAIQAQYQLSDAMVAKAMDFVFKQTNTGFSEANERIKELLNDPEQAPDLIMFLMDPAEFVRQKSNRKVMEEKRKTFKLIANSSKGRTTAPVDDEGNAKKGLQFEELVLDD